MGQHCYSVINVLHVLCLKQALTLDALWHVLAASLTFLVSDALILFPILVVCIRDVYIMRQETYEPVSPQHLAPPETAL